MTPKVIATPLISGGNVSVTIVSFTGAAIYKAIACSSRVTSLCRNGYDFGNSAGGGSGGTGDLERLADLSKRRLRPGANGGLGVAAVAHAAPDGHTLLAVASSALTINPLFYQKLPYDVDRDLAAVTKRVRGGIERKFGCSTDVICRTAAEMSAALDTVPDPPAAG